MKRAYLGLDLIRFAAAALVMLYHYGYGDWLPAIHQGPVPIGLSDYGFVFSGGWVGVPIFFILSGFVIAFSAHEKTAREFVIGRAARLYPAAWICASITAALTWNDGMIWLWLNSIILNPAGPWVSGVYWTLGIEICFYTMVAILLWLAGSKYLETLGIVIGAASSVYWAVRLLDHAAGGHFKELLAYDNHPLEKALLLPTGCYFALGIMLWSAAREGWSKASAVTAIVCVGSGIVAVAADSVHFAGAHGGGLFAKASPLVIWLLAVALIYASVRWNERLWGWLGDYASQIRTIGLLTYPLYLVHSELGYAIMLKTWQSRFAMPMAILCAVALAYIIVKLERYPRRLILAGARRTSPVAATLP